MKNATAARISRGDCVIESKSARLRSARLYVVMEVFSLKLYNLKWKRMSK